jgi:CrcB protein
MTQALYVFLAGGIGALCRWGVGRAVASGAGVSNFPWATFSVNVVGSFLMGYLSWVLVNRLAVPKELQIAVLTGLLGGFTTFSAFSLEVIRYIERGAFVGAFTYVMFSVVICVAMCALGLYIARS